MRCFGLLTYWVRLRRQVNTAFAHCFIESRFCQLPGTILRAPSASARAGGEAAEAGEASGKRDAKGDGADARDATRVCEGLVDCVIRARVEPTWRADSKDETRAS